MFLLKIGDKVKLNRDGISYVSDVFLHSSSDFRESLKNREFIISDINHTSTCEENNPNCTCDHYIKISTHGMEIKDLVQGELSIVDIAENINNKEK